MFKLFIIITLLNVLNLQIAPCTALNKVFRARVDSCPSCSLNRLPEVKKFVYEDVPKYEKVEFKRIPGAKPELVLLNSQDEELERIPLSDLNRKECNDLLTSHGLPLKVHEKIEL